MTVVKLIGLLQVLANKGHGGDEVQLLCCDDNPISGDGVDIKGVYAITGHPDKGVDGVYIDGTVRLIAHPLNKRKELID